MRRLNVVVCGHVNHGKSTLVRMLEKGEWAPTSRTERPAFVHLKRDDRIVTLVDLPGHEHFFRITAGGAFGADAAILAVDAKEGFMPQTREHLALLLALGIGTILLAVTRCDRLPAESLPARIEAIRARLLSRREGIKLHDTLALRRDDPCSFERLRDALFTLAPSKTRRAAPLLRLRIDRLFHKEGAGTVAAGIVEGAPLSGGETLAVAEAALTVTARSLQCYGEPVERAEPGTRVAVRLGSLPKRARRTLAPGMTLCRPATLQTTDTLEGRFEPAGPDVPARVTLLLGASAYEAGLTSLEEGFVRLRLSRPAAVCFGDVAVVLHRGRMAGTLRILTPIRDPLRRAAAVTLLKALYRGDTPAAFGLLARNHPRGLRLANAPQRFALDPEEAAEIAAKIPRTLYDAENRLLLSLRFLSGFRQTIEKKIESNPHLLLSEKNAGGMLKTTPFFAKTVLEKMKKEGVLKEKNGLYFSADSTLENSLLALKTEIFSFLENSGFDPPAPNDLFDTLFIPRKEGKKILKILESENKAVPLGEKLYASPKAAERMLVTMRRIAETEGFVDIPTMKKHFAFGRKKAVAWLEWLDRNEGIVKERGRRFFLER